MKTSTTSTESKTDSTQVTEKTSSEKPAAVDATKIEESPTDDFGYDLGVKVEEKSTEEKPKKEEAKSEEKSLTGYGKEEEKVEEPKKEEKPVEEKKPEEITEEEKVKKEINEAIKDLGEGFNKEKITKFALENKLTKEQLAAYVKLTKEEDAAFTKQQEENLKAQRKAWKQELLSDPEFGGENFDKNVDRVNKLLNQMPNTKKVLTEKGTMLPPYIMRDFLALSKTLNPTTKLIHGDPIVPEEDDDGNFLDKMYT